MSGAPAFQFYAHDFLAGRVATYSLDEIGAYSLLLAFDWSLSGLPLEPEKLAKLCRVSHRKFAGIWKIIGEQFPIDGDRRRNPRLKLEREKQEANREKKTAAAYARWHADAYPDASDVHIQNACPPSPTPSPVKEEKRASHSPPPKPRGADSPPGVEHVLSHYHALHPQRRPSGKDKKLIARRLETYSLAELCEALDGNAADEWHREKRKHELSYVFRDNGKIDEFRAIAEAQAPRLAVDPETGLPNEIGLAILRGGRAA